MFLLEMLKKVDELQGSLDGQIDNALATHSKKVEDSYLRSYKSLQEIVERHRIMEKQVCDIHSKIRQIWMILLSN